MKRCVSIFVSTIGSGGAEKQAALLAQALSDNFKVIFVVLYGDYAKSAKVLSVLKESGAELHLLSGSWFSRICKYTKILKENKVYAAFNYLTQCDFWGAIIAKIRGVKHIYNGVRNSEMEKYKQMLEFVSHNFVADGTIFNSFSGRNSFIDRGFREHKCITIPNCFTEISNPIKREDSKIKNIITVGRFVQQKDYKTAIRAISELKKKRTDFLFNIVGYGILEEEIRQWVKEFDISDVVKFHINITDITTLLLNSDIYLSTSLFEGTSNSIMEAMNFCLPVVATNVGDNSILVSDNKSGFLHPVGDFKSIAASLDSLLSNPELRNAMGSHANMILRAEYSFKTFKTRYLELLSQL